MRRGVAMRALMAGWVVTAGCVNLWTLTDRPASSDAAMDLGETEVAAPDANRDDGAVIVDAVEDAASAVAEAGLRGSFVAAGVSGNGGGYALRGAFSWHAAVRVSNGGFTLEGWLR